MAAHQPDDARYKHEDTVTEFDSCKSAAKIRRKCIAGDAQHNLKANLKHLHLSVLSEIVYT
jgi:hypothetical protein